MSPRIPRGRLYGDPLAAAREALLHAASARVRGERVDALEAALAAEHGVAHAVMMPHARVAFAELLAALDLRPGSRVLMTSVTIPDIVNVVLDAGLTPRWVDLAPRSGQIDLDDLARKADASCSAVLVTHLCGLPVDMDALLAIAAGIDAVVLEDASQAMGTRHRGQAMGTFGAAGVFSMTTLKPLSCYLGGLVLCHDDALAATLRRRAAAMPPPPRRSLARRGVRDVLMHAATSALFYDPWVHLAVGVGERTAPEVVARLQRGELPLLPGGGLEATRRRLPAWMYRAFTDVQADIALRDLPAHRAGLARRRALGARLHAALCDAGAPGVPTIAAGEPSFWRYPYFTPRPDALRAALWRRGVDSATTNLRANHREPAFAPYAGRCPQADAFVDAMVFLPLHPSDVDEVVDAVAAAVVGAEAAR